LDCQDRPKTFLKKVRQIARQSSKRWHIGILAPGV
jgi:hypothetical protein